MNFTPFYTKIYNKIFYIKKIFKKKKKTKIFCTRFLINFFFCKTDQPIK